MDVSVNVSILVDLRSDSSHNSGQVISAIDLEEHWSHDKQFVSDASTH